MAKAKLTPKMQKFVSEYLVDLNATKAVLRAGYKMTEKAAATQGNRLLRKAEIQEALRNAREAQERRTEITADRVLQELAHVAFANTTDFVKLSGGRVFLTDTDDLSRDQTAALSTIKEGRDGVEVRLHDKIRALELLGKHLGIFEKPEEQDAGGVKVSLAPEMEDWSE